MKKIGRYLIEKKLCDESSLKYALEQQEKLKQKGVFKPIGLILTEYMGVNIHDLNKALFNFFYDILSSSPFFTEVSKQSLEQTISLAKHITLQGNSHIFEAGDHPSSIYFVISGKIKVFDPSPDGEEKLVNLFGPGSVLGEIDFLIGKPYENSSKTISSTSLLVLAKKDFEQLCNQYPEISLAINKIFAHRLALKDSEIILASEQERAYQKFVSQESELSLPDLIGQCRTINNLRKKIHGAAENDLPVLVQGEPGTEKLVVAGTIHKNSPRSEEPFLSMDAENVVLEGYGAIPEEDSGRLQLEMAQSSVLFGYEKGAFSFSPTKGLGLLQICRSGTVVIENADKLTKGTQHKLHNYLVKGTFEAVGGSKPINSSARIIATTSQDLGVLTEQDLLYNDFLRLLLSNKMAVPPLKKRKSDLRLLVDFFIIMECFKTPDRKLIKGISPEAYQRIMEYDWPGNMDELQIVIRRAINLAQGEYLMPEDIFIGIAMPEGKYTINLLQFEKVGAFFKSRLYPLGLQVVTVIIFSLIFVMAFMGSQKPDNNISLLLVWGLWEPLLFISWFLGARIWCSVCPMGAMNDLLNRIGERKLKVPSLVSHYGVYFSALGVGVIIWAEVATDMPYSPIATGFLLLSIMSFAILSGIFFERRLWCRYLCPLGTLGAVYSGCSIVEWRANTSICNSTCKDNSCYKGDNISTGCPLYQGPFSLHSNQNCILCGRCVKLCPNDAPKLNLRIPGHELWAALRPEKITTIFVPVILGTQIFRGLEHLSFVQYLEVGFLPMWLIYAILLLASTAVSYSYSQISGTIAFTKLKNSNISKGSLFMYAMIPLAFAFEIGYQLNPLLARFGHFFPTLGRQFGFNFEFLDFAYQVGSIKPWQVLLLLLGIGVSVMFLNVLRKNHQLVENGSYHKRFRNLPVYIWGVIYIWMFVII
jgi:transcriptional regulator with AAA-type ATPase domain/ferredoxin